MTHGLPALPDYDDTPCAVLAEQSGASRLVALDDCPSTMDVAHRLAADGAPHGTVVVSNSQGAGRGRSGNVWVSSGRTGVWVSVILRTPVDAAHGVLSLRTGLALAEVLDRHADAPVQLKWPNDLFLHRRKLAGILTEARWRGSVLEWVVVGVGVNVTTPATDVDSAALGTVVRRSSVLVDVVRAVLQGAAVAGALSDGELSRFAMRDIAAGRTILAPIAGTVRGIERAGGLVVETPTGTQIAVAGSLVFSHPLAE